MTSAQCSTCSKTDIPLQICSRCRKASYCSTNCQSEAWHTHRPDCKRPNYLLKFQIIPEEINDPPVWRTLSVPATVSFAKLHRALQIAFDWASTHSYEFGVRDPTYDPDAQSPDDGGSLVDVINRLGVLDRDQSLSDEQAGQREYLVRVLDDADYSSASNSFGPVDRMHQRMWQHPRTPEKQASQVKLFELLGQAKYKGLFISLYQPLHLWYRLILQIDHKFTYTYDYGDCWVHEFSIVGSAPSTAKIRCIDGGGHYIAEDAGHVQGWKEVLEAYRATRPNKEQLEKRKWFERRASNADPAGLANGGEKRWDMDGINMKLSVLA